MKEHFLTIHIKSEEFSKEEMIDRIEQGLKNTGVDIIGIIGSTEISSALKDPSQNCHEAWGKHYRKIKDAW